MQDRRIAYHVWISLLHQGEYKEGEGEFEPNAVMIDGVRVSRVNLIGTVVNVFVKEENVFSSVSIDDGSGVVDVRAFRENQHLLKNVREGDLVLVVGRVKQYTGEVYVIPDAVNSLEDMNLELLRRVQLFSLWSSVKRKEQNLAAKETSDEHERLKQQVLEVIRASEDEGVTVEQVASVLQMSPDDILGVVEMLVRESVVYVPRPRILKVI